MVVINFCSITCQHFSNQLLSVEKNEILTEDFASPFYAKPHKSRDPVNPPVDDFNRGPKGNDGNRGPGDKGEGDKGPKGDKGDPGPRGFKGKRMGPAGPKGPTGPEAPPTIKTYVSAFQNDDGHQYMDNDRIIWLENTINGNIVLNKNNDGFIVSNSGVGSYLSIMEYF